ncbi:MAG: sigma-70 family RNA polymerase sigma factor [Anaerolineales bacterium]|nr:sigma-70 family RNA polymerase sigma factor [Anaerolineales bacterium]MCB8950436.1 sigma-70 family RNA polymerase sigma factor [Ardenticatenales bacterium]
MDEDQLIQHAQQGDITAYNRLVLHYQDAVYNVALRIMSDPAAAADAAQEAFISAYKALGRFRGGSFKAWLMRIVTNQCYDELRRYKRRPQSSLDELTEESNSFAFMRSDDPGPEAWQQRQELVREIEHCLEMLPDEQRIVTVLCDVEGYDYQEIATMMSTSLGTVKSRLSRARRRLRDCLQQVAELLPSDYRLENT